MTEKEYKQLVDDTLGQRAAEVDDNAWVLPYTENLLIVIRRGLMELAKEIEEKE